ncbi:2-amino-4-hydroxy-6-hydroxymethyldihydropteridine diphosphokinase [Vibrio sp.]|uniref:2-amino-4-hydroxy-6-hydroxymethyldihydropteridine pyrophosphokinase n=1 Tax=Vibrio viridaestus TaxID=2487322 RepID=A0A3N9TI08_9VIBR|nr:2-amino-4-hydroxy-6-hydroxymethyldihydropteridine diphosphokinase [Vibrio viridaestus]MDC0612613.1 2-amino-4-hydroxy-6-hydroxymethyldihydropteridine diphosphokinase [Vibrio sp.]RQW63829.1 2-amino-4-hydroxy-6-hydroxymethyldihydropteridine diphosphokinase [Vibrio viridaestus]
MNTVFIGVGSNLSDPVSQAKAAIDALKTLPDSHFIATSQLYSSVPMGPQDQPDYINAVVKIETSLSPLALLEHTQRIELEHGRVRKEERWGPRTLDLDILTFGNQTIDTERLVIPHYGMKLREFVLYPLAEIEPNFIFPDGTTLTSLLQQVDKNGLDVWH